MTAAASVSVVIPVLDGAETIGDLLAALSHQAGAGLQPEILVVDNGSTDGTPQIVQGHGVRLLHEPVRGPAAARNLGLRHATGEIVAGLDADTLPTRRWLREILAPFQDPAVGLVAGSLMCFQPQTPAERFTVAQGLFDPGIQAARSPVPFVCSANLAFRRDLALEIGGWDASMLAGEDIDFSHRLLRVCQAPIRVQTSAVAFHRNRRHPSELWRQAWLYGQGASHFYLKHPDHLPWGWRQVLLSLRHQWRGHARAVRMKLERAIGRAGDEEVLFADSFRKWNAWYWRGFYSFRRHRQYWPFPEAARGSMA